jgi:hypothetical protein
MWDAMAMTNGGVSMLFEMNLSTIEDRMKPNIQSLSRPTEKALIQSFITFTMNQISAYRRVDNFVLLVDEAIEMERNMKNNFVYRCDITSHVRSALLNDSIRVKAENGVKRLNVALVILPMS